ncbi:MAG: insulinase family protein [Bacteroidia bacterium]|nr:insulinase family protein [Bacteroidia bacterium]MDW8134333.1 insulinase family protein [Bacteroidia bacterium]
MWRIVWGLAFVCAQPQLAFQDTLYRVYVYSLKNGLTVIVSPNPSVPRAFVMVATRAGSKHDPADNTGLAHYLEHLLFKGTDRFGTKDYTREKPYLDAIENLYDRYNRTRDSLARLAIYREIDSIAQLAAEWAIPNEYDRMMSALGAEGTNAFTSYDLTAYVNDIPAYNLERLLKIEAERFRYPVFRLFHTELEAVYEEKNIAIDNEMRELHEKIMAALFPDHPYGTQTTIGTIEHLKNPSITAIKRYYQTYYVPNNMALIVVGDVQPKQVAEWAEKYFGSFTPHSVPSFPYPKGAPSPLRRKVFIEVIGPQAPEVILAFRLPPDGTPQAQQAILLEHLLSNRVTGLLEEWLVQTKKVKSAYSSLLRLADHSAFFITAEPKPGQSLQEVEKLLWEAVKRLQKGEFEEELIQAAVNDLLFNHQRSWRNNRARANYLLDAFVKQKPWKSALYETKSLSQVRKTDLVQLTRHYFSSKRCVVAYKKQGERPSLPKVPKPPITPLKIERTYASSYAEAVFAESGEAPVPAPEFSEFDKLFQKASLKDKVPFYATANTEDSLFTLIWYLPLGKRHDKWIPLIVDYYGLIGPNGMDVKSFKRKLFSLGCNLSILSNEWETYVIVEGLSSNLRAIVGIVDSLIKLPSVDESVWLFLRENVLQDRKDAKKNPLVIQRHLIAHALYGSDNPYKNVPSEREMQYMTAAELSRRAAELWHYPWEMYYDGPGGAEVAALLQNLISVPPAWQAPPPPRLYTFPETPSKKVLFVHFPMVRALMTWVHRSVPYQRDLYPLARYFTEYFGGGMSAVVFQEIREARGLAYAAGAYFVAPSTPEMPYYFLGNISTQADKVIEAYEAMEELIDSLRVIPSLARLSKQALIAELSAKRLRHEEVFYAYWEARRLGLSKERRADLWEALHNLDSEAITRFHASYVRAKPRVLLLIGDRARLPLQELSAKGLTLQEISLEEIFGY